MRVKWSGKKKGGLGNSGVTLFEVMIALAFFAIIITPVMRTFVGSIRTNKESREVMVATDVATSIMEGITNKTYYEVVDALKASRSGFSNPGEEKNNNAKLSLSSINNKYYNKGNVASGVADETNYSVSIDVPDNFKFTNVIDDQGIASKAIANLHGIVADPTDLTKAPINTADDAKTPDKLLYFGFSTDKYADDVPKVAFMLYSRIQRGNMFFDATVTFVPRSTNISYKADYTENDEFFVYEVTVKVYPYRYDMRAGAWVERFNADGTRFDDGPAAVMTSGIPNKSVNDFSD